MLVAIVILSLMGFRIRGLYDCTMGQYDLKRETDFRWLTGRCVVSTPSGWVYIEALRGIDNSHHGAVVDASH